MEIQTNSWGELKAIVDSKKMFFQYQESDADYRIFALDNHISYTYIIWKVGYEPIGLDATQNTIDRDDFETNYKTTSNTNLSLQRASPMYFRFDIPPSATKVSQVIESNIAGAVDNSYLISSGKVLTLQRLLCASSLSLGNLVSSKVELFYDPNGDGSSLDLITTLFTTGEHQETFISDRFVGDGRNRIRLRRSVLDIGSRSVFAKWEGHEI